VLNYETRVVVSTVEILEIDTW